MKSGNHNFLEPSGPLQARNGTALRIVLHLYVCGNLPCFQQPNYGERLDKLNLINVMFRCILCYFCVKFMICLKGRVTLSACYNRSIVQCSLRCWISGFLHHMLCWVMIFWGNLLRPSSRLLNLVQVDAETLYMVYKSRILSFE